MAEPTHATAAGEGAEERVEHLEWPDQTILFAGSDEWISCDESHSFTLEEIQ